MYWLIEEVVTPQGHYITLPDLYHSREAAEAAIAKLPSNQNMRVQAYRTGRYSGPHRVEE